jgi:hypothetical protein
MSAPDRDKHQICDGCKEPLSTGGWVAQRGGSYHYPECAKQAERAHRRELRAAKPVLEVAVDLEALARQIADEHAQAQAAMRTSVEHAVRTGELLIEAKRRVGHGGFQTLIQRYCEIAPRTAQAYMRLARELPKLTAAKAQRVTDLSLRDALTAVAADTRNIASLPPPAAEQALKEAKADRLRNAVSRQMTAERVKAVQATRPEKSSFETVVIEGAPAHPPPIRSAHWPECAGAPAQHRGRRAVGSQGLARTDGHRHLRGPE